MVGVVSGINQVLDSGSCCVAGHSLYIHIKAFLFLPCQPVLESRAIGIGRCSNNEHLHRCIVEVRMVVVCTLCGISVEQLLINDVEIGAIGLCVQVVGSLFRSTVELHFHLDVVEHTYSVLHGVVAHRFDGHLG